MAENQLILIADDFGLSNGINKGILELLSMGRLSGTSAMVNMPFFSRGATDLQAFRDTAEIGLHLTLTLGSPLSAMRKLAPRQQFPTLPELMRAAFLGQIDQAEMIEEIQFQITRFRSEMGFLPHYIDGHQHAHILPGVRSALFSALKSFPHYHPWIRNPFDMPWRIMMRNASRYKALFISTLSLGLEMQARAHGLRTNSSFSGVRAFTEDENFAPLFQEYLRMPTERHLVMCHPGYIEPDEIFPDPVKDTRKTELEFLKSDAMKTLLNHADLQIGRFRI